MNNRNKNNIMKKILEYGFIAVVSCFLLSCEGIAIPEAPYVVTELESCEGCKAQYKYKINSLNSPERYTEIITNQVFLIGDTLHISKQGCN